MNSSTRADFLIVGCGLAGATFARCAVDNGLDSHIIDRRNHIGGNCYSYKDDESKVEVHKYGPHIFHTSSKTVWDFVNRFTRFNGYVNRVKARSAGRIYSMPINLMTLNQFFNASFNPKEAKEFIDGKRVTGLKVSNFEEFIQSSVGTELYEAFFKFYTIKQWGVDPKLISVSTAKRLPIRFTYDDNYYDDIYQGIPIEGYTTMFRRILDDKRIKVSLETDFEEFRSNWRSHYKKLVFCGSIDNYFDYMLGLLPYRTVKFKEIRGQDIQGTSVINYTDMSVPFTRIHEHKWFTPEISFERSIAFEEYAESTTSQVEPYYPARNVNSEGLFKQYEKLAETEKDVIFIGRLAEFKYYDMHQVIGASLSKFQKLLQAGAIY